MTTTEESSFDADRTRDSETNEKARLEEKKLNLEIRKMSQPFFRDMAFWFAAIPLFASICVNLVQYDSAVRIKELAEIRKERLDLDTAKLEERKRLLEHDIDTYMRTIRLLQAQLSDLSKDVRVRKDAIDLDKILADAVSRISEIATDERYEVYFSPRDTTGRVKERDRLLGEKVLEELDRAK